MGIPSLPSESRLIGHNTTHILCGFWCSCLGGQALNHWATSLVHTSHFKSGLCVFTHMHMWVYTCWYVSTSEHVCVEGRWLEVNLEWVSFFRHHSLILEKGSLTRDSAFTHRRSFPMGSSCLHPFYACSFHFLKLSLWWSAFWSSLLQGKYFIDQAVLTVAKTQLYPWSLALSTTCREQSR